MSNPTMTTIETIAIPALPIADLFKLPKPRKSVYLCWSMLIKSAQYRRPDRCKAPSTWYIRTYNRVI